jgi:hypothetical protein
MSENGHSRPGRLNFVRLIDRNTEALSSRRSPLFDTAIAETIDARFVIVQTADRKERARPILSRVEPAIESI